MANDGSVGNIYKAAMVGELFGQEVVVTSFWQVATPNGGILDSRADLAAALSSAVNGNIAPLLSAALQFNTCQILDVVPYPEAPGGLDYIGGDLPFEGAVTTTVSLPPTVAVVTRKRTVFRGRKYRGRNFWPGIPQGSTSMGQLTTGALAAWNAAIAPLYAPLTNGADPGSSTYNAVLAAVATKDEAGHPLSYRVTVIASGDTDPVLRVQRRREIGVGI